MAGSHWNSLVLPSPQPVVSSNSLAGNLSSSPSPHSVAILNKKLLDEIKSITGTSSIQIANPQVYVPTTPIASSSASMSFPTKSSWADVVANDSGKGNLSFHPLEFRNGRLVILDTVHAKGLKSWDNCLVGTFLGGSSSNYGAIVHYVNKLSEKKGKILSLG
ncbi:hypothetical protein SLEP1_g9811 [Rubroshorea leprosula]|uniref:Uncharacterized protein n=1 Tax=Rubroshorea leprosula TaxID=152421 RepID=A0AAV5I623_9ROSI|nr:hypothetical protein SLEP1_g9811 [Rubroshorea leprosula]